MDFFIQALGIIAMLSAVISFQQKTQKMILIFQLSSNLLFIVHFLLLGGYTGGLSHGVCVARASIFALASKYKWASHKAWVYIFIVLFVVMPFLTLFCFSNTILTFPIVLREFLPAIGSTFATLAFACKKANQVRSLYLLAAPLWCIYSALTLSIGGAVSELLNIISIVVGKIRLDRKIKAEKIFDGNNQE